MTTREQLAPILAEFRSIFGITATEVKWLTDKITALSDWRDISTAPDDYTVVLLYQPACPGYAEAVGQGHRTDLGEHVHDPWIFQATGYLANPTLWQPLPAPPIAISSGIHEP